ncbi:hypothetical protein LX36DRAFT_270733 [Colletotrichum falcatum]|nr:hypothetical protein LX36DRAFT_270733 [Colletotrichum falcatum]
MLAPSQTHARAHTHTHTHKHTHTPHPPPYLNIYTPLPIQTQNKTQRPHASGTQVKGMGKKAHKPGPRSKSTVAEEDGREPPAEDGTSPANQTKPKSRLQRCCGELQYIRCKVGRYLGREHT